MADARPERMKSLAGALLVSVALAHELVPTAHSQSQAISSNSPASHCSRAGASLTVGGQALSATFVSDTTVHIHIGAPSSARSFALAPTPQTAKPARTVHEEDGCSLGLGGIMLHTSSNADDTTLTHAGHLLHLKLSEAGKGRVSIVRSDSLDLYGMRGIARDEDAAIVRNGGAIVRAGSQGEAGGPFFFTTAYSVLIGSDGGRFAVHGVAVDYSSDESSPITDVNVTFGPPLITMQALAAASGPAPMPPDWTLGFLHSLWGTDQHRIEEIAAKYKQKRIPLNAFIFDFDWKAWGEDDYGEWRWNSTQTSESFNPLLFPDGASGDFARRLRKDGIYLAGILKPRILLYGKDGKTLHQAARYAEDHHLWYPDEPATIDYFAGRASRDLNFNLPETRSWFWQHLQPSFDAGIVGWWNDEADHTLVGEKTIFNFNNLQFAHMAQGLYEGQRSHSDQRVWTLNRNYFLGAQRYAYAEWSGDIDSGWASMQAQPARMIATLNLGEAHWSMDIGGFKTDPTPENYARWIEFGAMAPVMRVHGNHNLDRSPWAYGPTAEAAATRAIRWRSAMLPYLKSAERIASLTGVGVARPLLWQYPEDAQASLETSEWMLGDTLLVSPVLAQAETVHNTYLPAGQWIDYWTGARFSGNHTVERATDARHWDDMPLYIRSGFMLALKEPGATGIESSACAVAVDAFPSANVKGQLLYYDDDGQTYAYERGDFYAQPITLNQRGPAVTIAFAATQGTYTPRNRCVALRIHGDLKIHSLPAGTRSCSDVERSIASEVSPDPQHVSLCVALPIKRETHTYIFSRSGR